MKTRTLLIEICLDTGIVKWDLNLRHILVDTIESRGLGEVVEETSSPEAMELVIEVLGKKKIEAELQELLVATGFCQYKIQDISNNDA